MFNNPVENPAKEGGCPCSSLPGPHKPLDSLDGPWAWWSSDENPFSATNTPNPKTPGAAPTSKATFQQSKAASRLEQTPQKKTLEKHRLATQKNGSPKHHPLVFLFQEKQKKTANPMGELQNPSFGSQKATQKEQRSACNALRASCTSVFGDLPGSRPERVGGGQTWSSCSQAQSKQEVTRNGVFPK